MQIYCTPYHVKLCNAIVTGTNATVVVLRIYVLLGCCTVQVSHVQMPVFILDDRYDKCTNSIISE